MLSNKKNLFLALCDLAIVNLALYIGIIMRFETVPRPFADRFIHICLIYSLAYMLSLAAFGMYRRIWRYASIREGVLLGLSLLLGATASTTLTLFIDRNLILPRSVIAIQFLLSVIFSFYYCFYCPVLFGTTYHLYHLNSRYNQWLPAFQLWL